MRIHRLTKDGSIEELKGYDMHLEILGEEDDYLIAMVIGDDDKGIVLTFDASDYMELRHSLILANNEIVKKIEEYHKQKERIHELEKAALKEFDC